MSVSLLLEYGREIEPLDIDAGLAQCVRDIVKNIPEQAFEIRVETRMRAIRPFIHVFDVVASSKTSGVGATFLGHTLFSSLKGVSLCNSAG